MAAPITSINNVNLLREIADSPDPRVRLFEVAVVIAAGETYHTATKPSIDLAAALKAYHYSLTGLTVLWANCTRDSYDGTTRLTISNANIALSSTGSYTNNVATFRLDTGATNGATGTELADGQSCAGTWNLLVAATLTAS